MVRAHHQERIRQAERSRLIQAVVAARQDSPSFLHRLTGSALSAAGGWLIAAGIRLQTDPPVMAWDDAEEQCC
jgi:hypothetical protein